MDNLAAKDPTPGSRGELSAILSVSAHARFWILACLVVALDLWTKQWAFSTLAADEARSWIPGVIELRRSLNDGAVFGSFTGYVRVFIIASIAALLFVLYMFATSGRSQRLLHVALALILAGALGNLYDRAFIRADVVEYVDKPDHRAILGTIISDPDDAQIVIGEWPDGAARRSFDPSEVTVRSQGVVRDFLKLTPRFPKSWPWLGGTDVWPWIFNVADAALVCGVVLLLFTSILDHRRARVTALQPATAP